MKKILYIQPIHPYGMDLLREKYNVVVAPDTNRETLMREIRDASAIVTRLSTVDADLMAAWSGGTAWGWIISTSPTRRRTASPW